MNNKNKTLYKFSIPVINKEKIGIEYFDVFIVKNEIPTKKQVIAACKNLDSKELKNSKKIYYNETQQAFHAYTGRWKKCEESISKILEKDWWQLAMTPPCNYIYTNLPFFINEKENYFYVKMEEIQVYDIN